MIDTNLLVTAKIWTKTMSQDKPDNVENIATLMKTSSKKCTQSMLGKFRETQGNNIVYFSFGLFLWVHTHLIALIRIQCKKFKF